jgi:hypothetical protein
MHFSPKDFKIIADLLFFFMTFNYFFIMYLSVLDFRKRFYICQVYLIFDVYGVKIQQIIHHSSFYCILFTIN